MTKTLANFFASKVVGAKAERPRILWFSPLRQILSLSYHLRIRHVCGSGGAAFGGRIPWLCLGTKPGGHYVVSYLHRRGLKPKNGL